jgi:hypothetical protein
MSQNSPRAVSLVGEHLEENCAEIRDVGVLIDDTASCLIVQQRTPMRRLGLVSTLCNTSVHGTGPDADCPSLSGSVSRHSHTRTPRFARVRTSCVL